MRAAEERRFRKLPRPRGAGGKVGERGRALGVLLVALSLLGGCGYGFAAGGKLTGGIERAFVLPFENRSTQPELGAAIAAALREELAARDALAPSQDGAVISGEVTASAPSPATLGGVSWRFALAVKAQLRQGGRLVAERTLRREADYPAGIDALETEGRRAQASRRLTAEVARELVSTLLE
jgi:hypothetical protein